MGGNNRLAILLMVFIVLGICQLLINSRGIRALQQATSAATSKRAFVCVTGQLSRLVLPKQMESIYQPLLDSGYQLDIALILNDGPVHFTNGVTPVNDQAFPTFQSALDYLHLQQNQTRFSSGLTILTYEPTAAMDVKRQDSTVRPDYTAKMDKSYGSDEYKKRRVENHARQFFNMQQCNKYFDERISYDFVLRLREDVAIQTPWNTSTIHKLQAMLLQSPSKPVISTSDCRHHGGINDRLALLSANVARQYFSLPFETILGTKPLHRRIHNPESFQYYLYKQHARIIKSPLLRGVVKYYAKINQNGTTNYHVASSEQNDWCPLPWWQGIWKHLCNRYERVRKYGWYRFFE